MGLTGEDSVIKIPFSMSLALEFDSIAFSQLVRNGLLHLKRRSFVISCGRP